MADASVTTAPPTPWRAASAMRIGDVLRRSATIFAARWPSCCAIMALGWAPFSAAVWISLASMNGDGPLGQASSFTIAALDFLFTIFAIACLIIASAAISFDAAEAGSGRSWSFRPSLGAAVHRSPAILALEVLIWLGAAAGALLLAAPGLIVLCMSAVALPACLVERLGPIRSLARSAFLTRGDRWRVFGLLCPLYVASLALGRELAFVAGLTLGAVPALLITLAYYIVVGAFNSVVIGVLYVQLRVAREGADIEPVVGVFD
jgi:hypothetical protein